MAQKTRAEVDDAIAAGIEDNTSNSVTPADVRSVLTDIVDSAMWFDEAPSPGPGGGAVDSVNGQTGTVLLDAADVDALSTAEGALKAPLANPTFTGTVSGITAAMVGLDQVDNTSDADKPISDAVQTALDEKATIEALDDITANETLLMAATATNINDALDGYYAFNPAALAETWVPLAPVTWAAGTQTIDASLGRVQEFTVTGNVTIGSCSNTYNGPIVVRLIASGGARTITLGAAFRYTGGVTFPLALADGDELTLQILVVTSTDSTTRSDILSAVEDSPAPLVDAEILSTSITNATTGASWSDTPGATFTITETGVGNPTPTKTRTMTFNGIATAETGTTWAAPTGKKGGGVVSTTWDNVDGLDGAIDTAETIYWVGKKQPIYIDAVTANRHGGAGPAAVAMTLPGGVVAGHYAVLYTNQQGTVDVAPPTGFTALDSAVPRISSGGSTSGNNQHFQIFGYVVQAADVTAGSITVQISDNSFALMEFYSGVDTASWTSDTNPTNWTRSAALAANSIDTPAYTPTNAAMLIAVCWSSHYADNAKVAAASGWTGGAQSASTNANASGYGIRTLRKLASDETQASFTIDSGGGTANATWQSSLLALYGPAN